MTALAADRPSAFLTARARCASRAPLHEPAQERGWFESSRELLAGLTVIEHVLPEHPVDPAPRAPWLQ